MKIHAPAHLPLTVSLMKGGVAKVFMEQSETDSSMGWVSKCRHPLPLHRDTEILFQYLDRKNMKSNKK